MTRLSYGLKVHNKFMATYQIFRPCCGPEAIDGLNIVAS